MKNSTFSLFRILISGFCLLVFVGCDPISGSFNVRESFSAYREKPVNNCNGDYDPSCGDNREEILVPAGQYDLKFNFRSKRDLALEFKVGSNKVVLPLAVPKGKTLPENGSVNLTAKESGQPFDLLADARTNSSDSPSKSEIESCWVRHRYLECGQGFCRLTEYVTPGTRRVEFFYRTTQKLLAANFTSPENSKVVFAQFRGEKTESEKIYLKVSECR